MLKVQYNSKGRRKKQNDRVDNMQINRKGNAILEFMYRLIFPSVPARRNSSNLPTDVSYGGR